jgi:hypothetical protein
VKILFSLRPSGREYQLSDVREASGASSCDSLKALEKTMAGIKKRAPGTRFILALGEAPRDVNASTGRPVRVQDLIDLMTLIASQGGDLKCVYIFD